MGKYKYCFACGQDTLVEKHGDYKFEHPPKNIVTVPNSTWQECTSCHESILPHKLLMDLEQKLDLKIV